MLIQQIESGLWASEATVRFLGLRLPARMTVIELSDQKLMLHSPIEPSEALVAAVNNVGEVAHLVAPSKYHHKWIGDWATRYPAARIYGASGLAAKRTDVRFHEVLDNQAPAAWSDRLDQCLFEGLPIFNEIVFYHRSSRTLIVSDFVFNIQEASGFFSPVILRLDGMWKRFGPSWALMFMLKRNQSAARAGVERVLEWDFDRVVMGHGRIVESGGRDAVRQAFSFLIGS